jgi:hypothetical protein
VHVHVLSTDRHRQTPREKPAATEASEGQLAFAEFLPAGDSLHLLYMQRKLN